MNKKQKNRKLVKQNKRNRIINRRYTSTIKSLFKLYSLKLNLKNDEKDTTTEILKLQNNLYSIIDKAIKKRVIHKNTAARKKSRIAKLYIKK